MAWQETFAILDSALRRGGAGVYGKTRDWASYIGMDRSLYARNLARRGRGGSWSNLAQGRDAADRAQQEYEGRHPTRPGEFPTFDTWRGQRDRANPGLRTSGLGGPPSASTTPGFPEKIEASLPYSSAGFNAPGATPQAPQSTDGDLLGSIGGSLEALSRNVTLGNAIPWLMERVNVASKDLGAALGGPSIAQRVAGQIVPGLQVDPIDAFIETVSAASQVAGPVLEAFPKWVQESQLQDRAKLYRELVTGQQHDFGFFGPASNPLATLGQIGSLLTNPGAYGMNAAAGRSTNALAEITGQTVSEATWLADKWRQELAAAVDPQRRLSAETHLAILRDAIDIPESVKLQIQAKPDASDDDIEKWLDTAPEGRAWSYQPGVGGFIQNAATDLLFYGAEARAGGLALKGLRNFGVAAELPVLSPAIAAGARGGSMTLKLMTGMTAAGVGVTAVDTAMGAVMRYAGNDEAVRWFDQAMRTTPFSDDPMVQLATSFAVNPFRVYGNVKKGAVTLKHGLVDVPLDAVTGNRLNRLYDSRDQVNAMIARMFKLGSKDAAADFLDETGLAEQAPDMVMGTALDTVLERLPTHERMTINAMHADPVERAGYVLGRYGQQALDLIEKEPALVAARFHAFDWQYRMMPGPFNANVAASIALDYRRAMNRTYDLRAQDRFVVGYREYLPPQGQALARETLDRITDEAGNVPVQGVDGIQGLIADFPALRKHWGGLVTGDAVPRADVERMLELAQADWAQAAKVNPIRVRTGVDPILRPDSPTPLRDQADALGTDIETVQAITEADLKSNVKTEQLRAYLVAKLGIDPAVAEAMTPEEAFNRAFDHFDQTTAPWVAMGERIVGAERQMTALKAELARVAERRYDRTTSDVTVRLRRQITELQTLLRTVGDPLEPFATTARRTNRGGDTHLAELAARKVDALERLRAIRTVEDELGKLYLDAPSLDLVVRDADGALAWAPELRDAPPEVLLDTFIGFKTAGPYNFRWTSQGREAAKERVRVPTMRAQPWLELPNAPSAAQWQAMAESPGFVAYLRKRGDETLGAKSVGGDEIAGMTGHEMADLLEGAGLARGRTSRSLDDIASQMGEGVSRTEALERLAELRRARDAALDGAGPATLRRTSAIKVPESYVAQAEADRAGRALVYDAEYEAFWHPRNLAKVGEITSRPELYPGLRAVVDGDPLLEAGIARVAERAGVSADDVLTDAAHAAAVRAELVPPGFEPPIEGMIRETTELDFLIRAGDGGGIATLAERFKAEALTRRDPIQVSQRVAARLAQMPTRRRSYTYRRVLSDTGADLKAAPAADILARPENRIGADVLSVLNHGTIGTRPATNDGVIALLRAIEDGDAGRIGIGPEMQAEAQRVARLLLDRAVEDARRLPEDVGTFGAGFFHEDEQTLAASIDDLLSYDVADPLGTLQYGLKKAPTDAIVMEWSKVPGLAEELLTRRFEPWAERMATARVRQGFNFVFGPRSNAAIRLETRNRFVERVGRKGIGPDTAGAIWDRWAQLSADSRSFVLRRRPTGERDYVSGDNPLYADIWNLPNKMLDGTVHGRSGQPGFLAELSDAGRLSAPEMAAARRVNFAAEFREASSWTRRALADRVPLGQALADTYGMVAHNQAITTMYYWFRFGLDVRYHAMNYLEAQILYAGRAGLRRGEIDEGLLGQSEGYLRRLDADPVSNTGYQFSRDRMAFAYRTFLKEQPDALRSGLKGLATEDPQAMTRAMEQMARSDPQLRDMVEAMGDSPDRYLGELDRWHRRMLANVDVADDAKTIDDALATAMRDTPELAQVFDRLGQVNKTLWDDIRQTFYGNPNRSRAERFLNSYLLFWPLSYQIKSTRWMLRVLGDRAGGIQTNAFGAYELDQLADTHNRLLATDPEYRDWYEKHDTLVFVAQMMFPVSFDSTGVSLNPALRSVFFDRTKAAMEVGPIYTFNRVIRPLGEEVYADLYPTLGDMPAFDGLYRTLTGAREPESGT